MPAPVDQPVGGGGSFLRLFLSADDEDDSEEEGKLLNADPNLIRGCVNQFQAMVHFELLRITIDCREAYSNLQVCNSGILPYHL